MKRSISILLALVMLLSITTSAFADGAPAAGETEPAAVSDQVPVTEDAGAGEPVAEVPAPAAEPGPAEEEPEPAEEPEEEDETIATVASAGDPMPVDLPEVDGAEATEEPKVTVTLHPGEGVFPYEFDQRKGYIEVVLDESRTLKFEEAEKRAPQRDGYTFEGWFAKGDGQQVTVGGKVPDGVTELEAHWKFIPRHVLLHVINGNLTGKWNDEEIVAGETSTIDVQLEGDETSTLPKSVEDITPTRTNGTFAGWYTTAPKEELVDSGNGYSYWKTVEMPSTQVKPGESVPKGVTTLYAAFTNVNEGTEEVQENDKLVTFYLDWNGIDGLWGHCMTVTRKYAEGKGYTLSHEDLLVAYLNWDANDLNKTFSDMKEVKEYWAEKNNAGGFNGYTFLGWAHSETANTPDVEAGEKIENGESLYAVWTKGDASNVTFDRTDPAAGLLEFTQILGDLNTAKHGGTHAAKDATFSLNLFCTPVRTTVDTITWHIAVTKSPEVIKADEVIKAKPETQDLTVDLNKDPEKTVTFCEEGLEVTARDRDLIIKDEDGGVYTVVVSADATGHYGDKTAKIHSNADAVVSFSHSWDAGLVTVAEADCTHGTKTQFSCTVKGCDGHKTEYGYPLGHVYSTAIPEGYDVLTEPTCTTAGEKQRICLRCGEREQDKEGKPITYPIAALGHDFQVTSTMPASCNKNEVTETCTRCGTKQTSLVPASNPDLHAWQEYDRYDLTCKLDRVYYRCGVCGETKYVDEEVSDNEHQYAVVGRTPVDCQQSIYHFECVYGCGAKKAMLKKEVNNDMHKYVEVSRYPSDCAHTNYTYQCSVCSAVKAEMKTEANPQLHVWGEWVETAPATEWQGGLKERSCNVCGAKETVTTATLEKPAAEAQKAPADNGGAVASGYAANSDAPAVASVPAANASSADVPAANAPAANASSAGASKTDTAKKLSTPKNIKAKLSGTSVKISWGKVAGAEKYQIFYKTGSGGWKKLTTTKSTSYTWKNAKAGTKYSFTVRCVSADGKTYTSDYDTKGVSVTTKKLATPKVSKVAKVSGGIKITWKKITGAEKYQVFYKTGSGGWKKLAATKSTSYTWKNAKAGTYKFTVRCVSADGKTYTSSYDTKGVSFTYKK